jgi:hypothetical protein
MNMVQLFVYYDLHRKTWSGKALEGRDKGKVIFKNDYIVLRNAHTSVGEGGRQRVIAEEAKNVHAGIVGEWDMDGDLVYMPPSALEVTYDPYLFDQFFVKGTEFEPWFGSDVVYMAHKRVYAWDEV